MTSTLDERLDLPQGTLDLLILKALSVGSQHGWAISERLRQVSRAMVQVPQGSLYPALHRLELDGMVDSEWGQSANNRRAKYYHLTARGRKQLQREASSWKRVTEAIGRVMETA
jgi:PadR family transcriptional regulator, regulatory protein PadR